MSKSSYPLKFRIQDTVFNLGLFPKQRVLRDKGYYRTMSGDYIDNHFRSIPNEHVKFMTVSELKKFIKN